MPKSDGPEWLEAEWPCGATARPRAITTTRRGGLSTGPFASLNLGERSGDDIGVVKANRDRLTRALGLASAPAWLRQVHGSDVVRAGEYEHRPKADAAWTDAIGLPCAVLTADCLPVALADVDGHCVAAVHAGWRGLASGVIESAVAALPVAPVRLRAWLGPAIGPDGFVVGDEVRRAFVGQTSEDALAFHRAGSGRFHANLASLARRRLARLGVAIVDGVAESTWSRPSRFFSHRRDGPHTGRMATLVWLESVT